MNREALQLPPTVMLAAIAPVAIGGILAARAGDITPIYATPILVFGVIALTAPALYIATAAAGNAPSLTGLVRALATAIGAFGLALAGLVLPVAFVSLSSTTATTTVLVTTAALAGAAHIAFARLRRELAATRPDATRHGSLAGALVIAVWGLATLGIAGRFWWDLAREVVS